MRDSRKELHLHAQLRKKLTRLAEILEHQQASDDVQEKLHAAMGYANELFVMHGHEYILSGPVCEEEEETPFDRAVC